MKLYKLRITQQNWHTFKGQLDAATHDELHIGDIVVCCANCNSVFSAVYVEDGRCPCGDHPFVGKQIRTGKIRLDGRSLKNAGKWRSTGNDGNNNTHRGALPLQLRWDLRQLRISRQAFRMNRRIVARVYDFVQRLCYIGLSVALGMAVALLLNQGKLERLIYLAERWEQQLIATWGGFLRPLSRAKLWISLAISYYMPKHFTALWQYMCYGAELLVHQPKSFFEEFFY